MFNCSLGTIGIEVIFIHVVFNFFLGDEDIVGGSAVRNVKLKSFRRTYNRLVKF